MKNTFSKEQTISKQIFQAFNKKFCEKNVVDKFQIFYLETEVMEQIIFRRLLLKI